MTFYTINNSKGLLHNTESQKHSKSFGLRGDMFVVNLGLPKSAWDVEFLSLHTFTVSSI